MTVVIIGAGIVGLCAGRRADPAGLHRRHRARAGPAVPHRRVQLARARAGLPDQPVADDGRARPVHRREADRAGLLRRGGQPGGGDHAGTAARAAPAARFATAWGIEAEVLGPDACRRLYPLLGRRAGRAARAGRRAGPRGGRRRGPGPPGHRPAARGSCRTSAWWRSSSATARSPGYAPTTPPTPPTSWSAAPASGAPPSAPSPGCRCRCCPWPTSTPGPPRCRARCPPRSCATRTGTSTSARTATGSASAPTCTGRCPSRSAELAGGPQPSMLAFTPDDFAESWDGRRPSCCPRWPAARSTEGFNGVFSFTAGRLPAARRVARGPRLLDGRGGLGDALRGRGPGDGRVDRRRAPRRSTCTNAT